ncbi:MAG: hydroxylaminobenzene mutase [Alphaproteobacteria bacterium]|nr:hydroxylaminobenzene mutase [Alphaproteobacteria bacterium]MBL6939736.1 hydroxylaminobenzene mutase [Alphaproteobacteria bacterium]MBL7096942.1 hydroxylaminobenzene mutase [Alphaproteobacteria bacterium]
MTATSVLCFSGFVLFFLGLVNGFVIPAGRSPRIGLSGHLAGVQSGTFLMAAGFVWPMMHLWPALNLPIAHVLWVSLFAVWISLLLGGLWGAGRGLPIAGGGITTTSGKQMIVSVLLIGGSIGTFVATAAALVGWSVAL